MRVTNAQRVIEFLREHSGKYWCDECVAKGITASGRDMNPPLRDRLASSVQPITKVLEYCPGFAGGACSKGHLGRAVSYTGFNKT